jgi:hypothetical protein
MEIADKQAQLALTYLVAATDNGHRLSPEEFEAFMLSPRRVVRQEGGIVTSIAR